MRTNELFILQRPVACCLVSNPNTQERSVALATQSTDTTRCCDVPLPRPQLLATPPSFSRC